jgi:hypothetical protein
VFLPPATAGVKLSAERKCANAGRTPFGSDIVNAYNTLKNWKPDAYEKFTGRALKPGDSYIRDQQTFRRDHANALIAVSASGSGAARLRRRSCLCSLQWRWWRCGFRRSVRYGWTR